MKLTLSQRLRLPLVAAAFVMLAAVWGAVAYQLLQLRGEAIANAKRHGENITAIVSEHFVLFAETVDDALKHLRTQWRRDPSAFSKSIADNIALPDGVLNQITVADAQGRLLYPVAAGAGAAAGLADKDYFEALKKGVGAELSIGRPALGQTGGKIGIPFALALRDARGRFRGVVVASIAADRIIESYKGIDLGPTGFITLRHVDGTIVLRSRQFERMLDGPRPEWQRVRMEGTTGSYVRPSSRDGVERVYSFRKLSEYPFIAMVGQDLDSALERWYEQRRVYLAGGALISLAIVLLVSVTLGRLKRVERAEMDLRESENRYRALTGLSADWYWELDAEYRFVTLTPNTAFARASDQAGAHLGKRPWEMPYADPAAADWLRCRALIEGRQPFRDVVLKAQGRGGEAAYLNVRGHPEYDSAGAFKGFRGITKNVTQKRRGERLLELEHAVNRSLAGAEDKDSALRAVMRDICETEHWECGRLWLVDEETGTLRFAGGWGVGEERIQRFIEQSRDVTFKPGEGMAGHVWETHEPLCVADIDKDTRSAHANLAREYGLHGAFVFPATSDGRVVGVLGFASDRVREPDERLLQAARVIGGQIGQFVQRKRAEEVLRRSEERFRSLLELSSDMYWEQDEQFRFTSFNGTGSKWPQERHRQRLGKTRWEQNYINMSGDDWAAHKAKLDARLPFHDLELCRIDESGAKTWTSVSGQPVFDPGGAFRGYRGVGKDITERKRADELLRLEHAIALCLAEADNFHDALRSAIRQICESQNWEVGRYFQPDEEAGVLRFVESWSRPDPALEEFLSASRSATFAPGVGLVGTAWKTGQPLWVPDLNKDGRAYLVNTTIRTGIRGAFLFAAIADGQTIGVFSFSSRDVRKPDERLLRAVRMIGSQIGQFMRRKEGEDKLAYLAQFDSLTGLPNRHLFRDRLMQAMARAKRTGSAMAVLFIDLDRFKLINDTLGHGAGDRLLMEATERLRGCVRSSDTVGRFGGDEFGAIIGDLTKPADASIVAQKIIDALARPFNLDGHESYVTASIGITLFPTDGEEAGALIMNADAAMYRAKEQGRNTYQYFTREMNERAMQRVTMESALRRAMERREFLLHYQPKVRIATGEVCGFEALLRWQHPEQGLVPPLQFIPVLEDTGLIVPVGEWVIGEVCQQIARWQLAGFRTPPVAVNLSARQFQLKGLEESVGRALRATGIDPQLLQFELTESLLMKEPEVAARALRGLKKLGVTLSVDDFGTGYSSLSYLKRFPIDALKIDRAFIRDVTVDPDDAAITLAIIGLAHSLKLDVIAEGVETRDQLRFLETHGCDEMQGFLFSRPVPAEECALILRDNRRLAGTRARCADSPRRGPRRAVG